MKLTEMITRKAIIPSLKASDKQGAIQELAKAIKKAYAPDRFQVKEIVDAVMERERLGSTGLGAGVAVPHARAEGIRAVLGAFGRHPKGIDFSALDGEPVHLVFLIVSPVSQPEEYQRALKCVMEAIRRPNFCRFLKSARAARDIEDTFREAEEAIRVS
jgi:mannitol/fructose-specific phosphotransferase system IIA component (Ntr-type)